MPEYEKVRERLEATAQAISQDIFPGLGFCLLLFKFHEPGISNYISNANRKEMIQALRETADRLESHADWQQGQEN